MSEEQNDSPAFRLRPRRAAPKSYYTVRLEYSANPAAFIRERPRSSTKRRVFTQKSGSNSTKAALNQTYGSPSKSTVVSKEDREREERRISLHRDTSQSITTNTLISPFMQRLQLDELEPDSIYEHNYITLRIKDLEIPDANSRLLCCTCNSVDQSLGSEHSVKVELYSDYADISLVKRGKIINIAKFKTGPLIESVSQDDNDKTDISSNSQADSTTTTIATSSSISTTISTATGSTRASHDNGLLPTKSIPSAQMYGSGDSSTTTAVSHEIKTLPFNVIVKPDDRRLLIPFVSITDMIEKPTEPYVEMPPPSPKDDDHRITKDNNDHENMKSKKLKMTSTDRDCK